MLLSQWLAGSWTGNTVARTQTRYRQCRQQLKLLGHSTSSSFLVTFNLNLRDSFHHFSKGRSSSNELAQLLFLYRNKKAKIPESRIHDLLDFLSACWMLPAPALWPLENLPRSVLRSNCCREVACLTLHWGWLRVLVVWLQCIPAWGSSCSSCWR